MVCTDGGILLTIFTLLYYLLVLVILIVVVPVVIRKVYYSQHPGEIRTPYDYTLQDGKFFEDFKLVFWHRRILKQKLVSNLHYTKAEQANNEAVESTALIVPGEDVPRFVKRAETTAKEEQECTREDFWTNRPTREILRSGYLPTTGLPRVSGLLWAGVPVFVSITGAFKFDTPKTINPKTGMYDFPQHTPALMENMIKSQATKNFLKKFRTAGGPAMDSQAIIMVILLAVGAVAAMWIMGFI